MYTPSVSYYPLSLKSETESQKDCTMRKAFITGGSKGIGKAICTKLAAEGIQVISPTRNEVDLGSNESVLKYIDTMKNETFDIIVNNAGINDIHTIDSVTDEEIERMFTINTISPMKLLRAFIPSMKKNNYGRIVNIGSIWAVVSKSGRGVYSATKNAMHGITNTLALELAENNILVNTVCPGFTLTELTEKNNDRQAIERICEEIPIKRMANPSEIAELVYFLVSEKNTYLTGQKITIDGGFTVK